MARLFGWPFEKRCTQEKDTSMLTTTRLLLAASALLLMTPALTAGQSAEDELRGIRRAIERQAYEARQRQYAEEQRRHLDQVQAGLTGLWLALEARDARKAALTPVAPSPLVEADDPEDADEEPEVTTDEAKAEKKGCPPWWRRNVWTRCK